MVSITTESIGSLSLTVTGATGNGVSPIVLTCTSVPTTVEVGMTILVASVGGNTNANGTKVITALDYNAGTITFAGTGNGAYTSGGTVANHYSSIALWNSAHNTENLVSGDDRYIGEMHLHGAADYLFLFAAGTTYTVQLTGCTTDATRYRHLKAWSGHRYNPVDRSGIKIQTPLDSTNRFFLRIAESFFRIEGFGIEVTALSSHTSNTACIEVANGAGVQIDSMCLYGQVGGGATSKFFGIDFESGAWIGGGTNGLPNATNYPRLSNTIIVGSQTTNVGLCAGILIENQFVRVYNSLVANVQGGSSGVYTGAGYGFFVRHSTNFVVNCAAVGCRVAAFGTAVPGTLTIDAFQANASDDTSATTTSDLGTGSQNGTIDGIAQSTVWRYAAFEDFRLLESSPLVGKGVSLASHFTTDLAGVTRTQPWNIGPYAGFVSPDTEPPTEVVSSIGSGMDYATPQLWEAATELHLIARNEIHRGQVYGSLSLVSEVVIDGAVSDARRYRVLENAPDERYNPTLDTGAKLDSAQINVVRIEEDYAQLRGLRIDNTSVSTDRTAVKVNGAHVTVDSVVGVVESATGSDSGVFENHGASFILSNSVAIGNSNTAGAHFGVMSDGSGCIVANCVAVRIRQGTSAPGFTDETVPGTLFVNCVALSSDVGFAVEAGYQERNASFDTTASGIGSFTSIVAADTFVDSTVNNFRLLGTSPLVESGSNLSYLFTTDIEGEQRGISWSLGVFASPLRPPARPADEIGSTSSLARIFKITRRDGVSLRYCDDALTLLHNGVTYNPQGSFNSSTLRTETGNSDHSFEAVGLISDDNVSDEDLERRIYDGARVEISLIDLQHPWLTPIHSAVLWIDEIKRGDGVWTAQLTGASRFLEGNVGTVLTKKCTAELGDARCGVALTLYRHLLVEVDTVGESRRVFNATTLSLGSTAPSGQTIVDGWFTDGYVTWRTGNNAGHVSQVSAYTHATRTIEFYLNTPAPIEAGDTFDIVAGCAKDKPACKDKFSNLRRMRAQLFVPGTDKTLQTPTR